MPLSAECSQPLRVGRQRYPPTPKGYGWGLCGTEIQVVGLWLHLGTVPAKEPQNRENDIREMGRRGTAKVPGLVLSLRA